MTFEETIAAWEAEANRKNEALRGRKFSSSVEAYVYELNKQILTLISVVRKQREALIDIADETYGYSSVQKHFAREAIAEAERMLSDGLL